MRGNKAFLAAVCVGGLVVGCAPPKHSVTDLGAVSDTETLVVGKIELEPPLGKGVLRQQEHQAPLGWSDAYRNKILVSVDKDFQLDQTPAFQELEPPYFRAELDQYFFAKVPRRDFYMNWGHIIIPMSNAQASEWDDINIPFGFKVKVDSDDRSVYIGNFRFKRTMSFQVQKIERSVELGDARAAFRERFGEGGQLQQAPVQVAEQVKAAIGKAQGDSAGE